MIGQTITHHRVLDKLGGGGMGSRDAQAVERFQREARAAVNLGWAFIRLGRYDEGKAVFAQAAARRIDSPTSLSYPLAHLWLGGACAQMGDTAGARKAYQDFLALWKDADPDIPILIEARQAYSRLKGD